ncbi:hypothetical protein IF188_09210 [Microbacterium sp. NEAU-LLC]|uniref:FtsX-like permease family protein n=1 Tax=Microbacterium helvum TaxID=2773713 RepID=A0ABR8NQM5_9MICO|nr:hypothetical protein [Microbacterium helvum]MBD3941871.1 hypothetical protein [Microbacterium helvum]
MSRARGALPGPLRRLLRQPLRAAAVGLLAASALATAGIQSAASAALRATMDDNWRGAYDILVTPTDAFQPVGELLPPNTLASTGSGMTFDDLEAVRDVAGVEIAAPIGEIVAPRMKFGQVRVAIPRGFVGADDAPQAYRLTITYTTDDGLGERVVETQQVPVVVDESTDEHPVQMAPCEPQSYTFDGHDVDPAKYPALAAMACMDPPGDGVTVYLDDATRMSNTDSARVPKEPVLNLPLPGSPQTMTRITLVDPVAEKQLLGEAGAFLDPLIAVDPSPTTDTAAMATWADSESSPYTDAFHAYLERIAAAMAQTPYTDEQLAELRALWAADGDDYDQYIEQLSDGVMFTPLLVATTEPAQLSVRIDVEGFGAVAANDTGFGDRNYVLPEALQSGGPGTVLGGTAADVSGLLNPFVDDGGAVAWPGAEVTAVDQLPVWNNLGIMSVGTITPAALTAGGVSPELGTTGYRLPLSDNVMPGQEFTARAKPEALGAEASYVGTKTAGTLQQQVIATPVGSFDPADIDIDESAADYVPLGAYAPVSSTVTGGEHAGTTMLPSLTGLGLVSPRTVAIGSLASAAQWRDASPISSIRVRVGGIDGYTREAQEKVIEVAREIEDLGFDAAIVAGSSPTDVDVQVEGYAFGTMDPAGTQTVGPLGAVTQRWSELGAAARVSLSVSTATITVLGISLAAGILLLGAVQLAGVPGRREQAAVMRETGFTRVRIARWFAAEEVPGLIAVTAIGAIALWLSGGTGTAALVALVAVGAVLVTSIASVAAGSAVTGLRMPRDARSRRLGARSVPGFGARQALVHPLASITHVLAILIVGLSAAGLVAALLAGREGAGESSLALLTIARQLWPQVLLGAAGVVSGILLARLTRRLDLARRSEQWATLRATGWTTRQLATAQRVEGLVVSLPAIALTGALAWFGAEWLELAPRLYAGIAVIAAVLTALISHTVRRKGTA